MAAARVAVCRLPPLSLSRAALVRKRQASFYDRRFVEQALQPLPRISLQTLVAFDKRYVDGEQKLLVSAEHVRRQLPTRLARRIVDMNQLPYICGINPHMQHVYDTYTEAFNHISSMPRIITLEQEVEFCATLRTLLENARSVLPRLARASKEISRYVDSGRLNKFIDDFLVSRISRRVLAEQHLALHEQHYNPQKYHPDDVGTVTMHCDAVATSQRAYETAASICRSSYGVAPPLTIVLEEDKAKVHFSYITRHVEYILLELFKNAVRATVEHHTRKFGKTMHEDELKPVVLKIFSSRRETHFQITDQGGGIPNKLINRVWDYAYTSVGLEDQSTSTAHMNQALPDLAARPMAGEGFGLPMARNYARYFGGELSLQSMQGHGTEVFLRLAHLDRKAYLLSDKEAD